MFLIPMSVMGVSTFWFSLIISLVVLFFCNGFVFNQRIYVCFFSFALLLSFNILIQFVNVSFEIYVLKITVIGVILFYNACLIVLIYRKWFNFQLEELIIKDIVLCSFINSLFAILLLSSGSMRSTVFSIVDTHPANAHHLNIGVRSSGLFYFGGSILSVFNFISLYLTAIVISGFKLSIFSRFFYWLVFFILLVGIFLSGRFGLMLACIGCLIVFFTPRRFHLINKNIVVFMMSSVLVSLLVVFSLYYDFFAPILDRSLELFLNMYRGDGVNSESTDILGTMFIYPSDYILGDGSFGRDSDVRYIPSDVGYILMLFYSGVFGLVVYFFHFALQCVIAFSHRRMVNYSFHMFILCLLCFVIGNFKDVYFYGSQGVTQLYLIFLVMCCYSGLRNKNQFFDAG